MKPLESLARRSAVNEGLQQCAQCGGRIPADAPQGLCPRCLLAPAGGGSASPQGSTPTAPVEAGSPPAPAAAASRFTAPDPREVAPLFPQLEIQGILGQGGMGVVYRARQVALDRPVALKILPVEVASDPAFSERFAREARALARLSHPRIVSVFDFGRHGRFYWFLMELVEGVNLREAIRSGKLSAREALTIVGQVCEALAYAHDEGVVHRDIKPENVLLDRKGQIKIADFGLAKLLDPKRAEVSLTGSGQLMGTPHYMAPEQFEKPLEVDRRADIYSLGVMFYEMLTGELPLG